MRFTAIALLLGATSAYVITNNNAMADSAVAARNLGVSGTVSEGVIDARDPHHKGRKGKNNKRDFELEDRSPHHKGRKGKNNRRQLDDEEDDEDVELETRDPHREYHTSLTSYVLVLSENRQGSQGWQEQQARC